LDEVRRQYNESKTFRKTHLRKVQDYQAQGPRYGYLRKSQAQAEAGLRENY
jgi:hypothetical protein